MKTCASIVVHKTPAHQLEKALECLSKSEVETIFVIDNSPTEELRNTSLKFDKVKYIKVENRGYGAGHNVALKLAKENGATFHLVMNADIFWNGDVIGPLVEFMERNRDVGLVAPKTDYPDGSIQATSRMLPSPADLFFKRFLPPKMAEKRMNRYLLKDYDHSFPLNSPYLLGSFLFFRMKALEETGFFDERFFMYPEDIDITRRLHKNWKTIYWPKVAIVHEHQRASQKNLRMFLIHFRNMVKYFNKWGWWKDNQRKYFNSRLEESINGSIKSAEVK